MNKLVMFGAIATLLLSQASVSLASDIAHSSTLVNFPAPKMIKLVHSLLPTHETMPPRSVTMCMYDGFEMKIGKGFPEGIIGMSWYIQNDTGAFEPIQSYDLLFKGGNGPADPKRVAIDMSAYADYPTCTPDHTADSVMEFSK